MIRRMRLSYAKIPVVRERFEDRRGHKISLRRPFFTQSARCSSVEKPRVTDCTLKAEPTPAWLSTGIILFVVGLRGYCRGRVHELASFGPPQPRERGSGNGNTHNGGGAGPADVSRSRCHQPQRPELERISDAGDRALGMAASPLASLREAQGSISGRIPSPRLASRTD